MNAGSKRDDVDALRIEHRDEPPRRRSPLAIVAVVLLPLLAVAVWLAWSRLGSPRAVPVRTSAVRESASEGPGAVLNASGYVTARRRATVSAKVTGRVEDVFVEEGMDVREGAVLARLDDTSARSQLAWSQARLEAARKALSESEARARLARLTRDRTRELVAQGIAGQAELDAAETELEAIEARIALGREEVEVAGREVAVRRTELADTVIRAPFDGVAISKDAQPGEMVSPISAGGGFTRTGICTIVDMDSLEIEVDVNESYINRVTDDQRVEAVLDAYPDWRIPARVITTVPAADRQKATVRVRIGFDDLDPRILPDMGVKVSFLDTSVPSGETKRGLVIPRAAVRAANGDDVVFVVTADGIARRRAIALGAAAGDEVVVLSGLVAGERVVVEGPPTLEDGVRVTEAELR